MAQSDFELLTALSQRLLDDLGRRTPAASGKTALARRAEVTKDSMTIYMPLHFKALTDSRGPTISQQAGNPTVYMQILDWIKNRGITPRPNANGTRMTVESLAFVITRKIHRVGFEGRPEILEGWFKPSDIQSISEQIARSRAVTVMSDLKDLLTQAA